MLPRSMRRICSGFLGVLVFTIVGCATSDERAAIKLGQLARVPIKREGIILVRKLTDMRSANHRAGIGQKRHFIGSSGGFVYHLGDGSLEEVLTEHVAATLRHVGYNAEVGDASSPTDKSQFDGILEGDIEEFWMNMYIRGWALAYFRLRLIDPRSERIVWERRVTGRESAHVGMGSSEGFEEVISLTLTEALNEAARGLSSYSFCEALKKR